MCRKLQALLFTIVLCGCGGNFTEPGGFRNLTRHSDKDLWAAWRTAQQTVANQVDLNPLQRSTENAPAVTLPGDVRAFEVEPHAFTVTPQPDVSSQTLLAATGTLRSDPTGLIACPQPCDVSFAAAYSLYRPPVTRYAASWESVERDFDTILEYEFENQILFALGYDLRWR